MQRAVCSGNGARMGQLHPAVPARLSLLTYVTEAGAAYSCKSAAKGRKQQPGKHPHLLCRRCKEPWPALRPSCPRSKKDGEGRQRWRCQLTLPLPTRASLLVKAETRWKKRAGRERAAKGPHQAGSRGML